MFIRLFLVFTLLLYLSHAASENDALSNHMRECCTHGVKHARKHDHCENYEYEVSLIPPLWIGLCHSTYGVCCSREVAKQQCIAGRLAAMRGLDCNKKQQMNATTAYADCCRWCHLGLAVKASDSSCDDSHFQYFNEIESYRICCGNSNSNNNNNNNNIETNSVKSANEIIEKKPIETDNETDTDFNTSDGTIVLQDNDDDICGKVINLCQHICENTLEAYRCKCFDGYTLNEDNVTCSPNEKSTKKYDVYSDDLDEDLEVTTEEEENCTPGYIYDKITKQCVDLDECAVKGAIARCKDNQFCHNTIGSYHCLNKAEANKYDECACGEGYSCVEYGEHYKCVKKCPEGFELSQGTCVDVDECTSDDMPCTGQNQTCINDIGGYHCECKVGFRFDISENECVDINECSINNHDCLPTQRCDNTLGSYICTRLQSCGTGYTLDADNGICVDNDECLSGTHTCPPSYDCHNTKGSFRCYRRVTTTTSTTTTTTTTTTTPKPTSTSTTSYNRGYNYGYPSYWNRTQDRNYPGYSSQTHTHNYVRDNVPNYVTSDGKSSCDLGFQRSHLGACVDINECIVHQPCGSHQRCINTNGSYRCQNLLDCGAGYRATPDGTRCLDINECETGEHNCAHGQTCENRKGGFICSCPPGYHLKPGPNGVDGCEDIDECEPGRQSVCPINADCLNTIGSYYCECKNGFQKSKESSRICVDIDECKDIPGLCQHKCNNFWGGYRCSCEHGYELYADNRTCVDVNECELHKNYKLCMSECINVPGSYKCGCPRGYTLEADNMRCRDIDECATGNYCHRRYDICTNTHGGHKCTDINCPYGYQNDEHQKNRCLLMHNYCEGESCFTKPSAYTWNFITLTSNLTIQPEGRMIFLLQGPKFYDNIDFSLKLVKVQGALNVEKATDSHFEMVREEKHQVALKLTKTLVGPQDIELELSMTVFTYGLPRGKSVTKILIFVSQYNF